MADIYLGNVTQFTHEGTDFYHFFSFSYRNWSVDRKGLIYYKTMV